MIGLGLNNLTDPPIAPRLPAMYDADVIDYFGRVEAATKTAWDVNMQRAVHEFIVGLKSDPSPNPGVSNYDALTAIQLYSAVPKLSGTAVAFKGPNPTLFNFVEGDYLRKELRCNSTSEYVDTNVAANSVAQNNVSICVFPETRVEGTSAGFAASLSTSEGVSAVYNTPSQNTYRMRSPSTSFAGSSVRNLMGASRNSSANYQYLVNGVVSTAASASVSNNDTSNVLLFRRVFPSVVGIGISLFLFGNAVNLATVHSRVATYMNRVRELV